MVDTNSSTFKFFRTVGYFGGKIIRCVIGVLILKMIQKRIKGSDLLLPPT